MNNTKPIYYFLLTLLLLSLNSCGIYKKVDARTTPPSGPERAKKNIVEGKGISIKNARDSIGGSGSYEFSTSNPLWRASLDTLDTLPLTTVDYSGGLIITDWYSDENANEAIKISIRFLSNEITANSLKIIIHKKTCSINNNCSTKLLKSNIEQDLRKIILAKAASLEKNTKK